MHICFLCPSVCLCGRGFWTSNLRFSVSISFSSGNKHPSTLSLRFGLCLPLSRRVRCCFFGFVFWICMLCFQCSYSFFPIGVFESVCVCNFGFPWPLQPFFLAALIDLVTELKSCNFVCEVMSLRCFGCVTLDLLRPVWDSWCISPIWIVSSIYLYWFSLNSDFQILFLIDPARFCCSLKYDVFGSELYFTLFIAWAMRFSEYLLLEDRFEGVWVFNWVGGK